MENGLQARRKRRFRKTTDVTAIWTLEGWLYLAIMLDLYSRRVVSWAVSANNDTLLALDTLRAGLRARRPAAGLVHHSDRGGPYASADYRAALATSGLVASMSRKGDCWDNAVAESFFGTLRAELIDHEQYRTHEAATRSIADYVERFYNIERRHPFLDYLNPIEFELRSATARVAA
jgi:transposase InsO family protein